MWPRAWQWAGKATAGARTSAHPPSCYPPPTRLCRGPRAPSSRFAAAAAAAGACIAGPAHPPLWLWSRPCCCCHVRPLRPDWPCQHGAGTQRWNPEWRQPRGRRGAGWPREWPGRSSGTQRRPAQPRQQQRQRCRTGAAARPCRTYGPSGGRRQWGGQGQRAPIHGRVSWRQRRRGQLGGPAHGRGGAGAGPAGPWAACERLWQRGPGQHHALQRAAELHGAAAAGGAEVGALGAEWWCVGHGTCVGHVWAEGGMWYAVGGERVMMCCGWWD